MSLYDEHPLPWRVPWRAAPGIHPWTVVDAESRVVGDFLSEPVLLDADRSDEAPEVSMVSTVSLQRLRETLEQTEGRDAE